MKLSVEYNELLPIMPQFQHDRELNYMYLFNILLLLVNRLY